jgi:hypothetical protein
VTVPTRAPPPPPPTLRFLPSPIVAPHPASATPPNLRSRSHTVVASFHVDII